MKSKFEYDNFVQSEVAMGTGSTYNIRLGRSSDNARPVHEAISGNQSRASMKKKVSELVELCKEENQGIKREFKQVMGAEREILDLMKDDVNEPPRFNNYAHSNVEMFPSTTQLRPVVSSHNYQGQGQQHRPSSYKQIPLQGRTNYTNSIYQPQPQSRQPRQPYPRELPRQNFRTDYSSINPNIPTSNFGYASGHPNDNTAIQKSKILELGSLTNQSHHPKKNQELEIKQLQQQVAKLRNLVQNYENQIAWLNNHPGMADKAQLLRQLKEQGQRIRQDTLALLRAKGNYGAGQYDRYGGEQRYGREQGGYGRDQYNEREQGYRREQAFGRDQGYPGGSYGYTSGAPKLIASQHKIVRGLNPDQEIYFRSQLNDLRMECEQLQQENANLKRVSKSRLTSQRRY